MICRFDIAFQNLLTLSESDNLYWILICNRLLVSELYPCFSSVIGKLNFYKSARHWKIFSIMLPFRHKREHLRLIHNQFHFSSFIEFLRACLWPLYPLECLPGSHFLRFRAFVNYTTQWRWWGQYYISWILCIHPTFSCSTQNH